MIRHIIILSLMAGTLQAYCRPGDFSKEFTVEAGKKLTMDLQTGGSIHITGWDRNLVSVRATIGGRDAEDCTIDAESDGSGVRVSSHYKNHRRNNSSDLEFEVNVPGRFDVHCETMGGGVSIEGVEGEIDGKTMGGKLELSKLKGHLDLVTMGGPITLQRSEVDGSVHTMGGSVRLEDVVGNVKATTQGGSVTEKNVTHRGGGSSGGEARISTMGGAINVDDAPTGADVKTMGGNIHIRSAAAFAKAETMGGDISIDAIDGRVDATTMGGDVEVTMVGDPAAGDRSIRLTSMSGTITLFVPERLSMDVDIDLAYTKDRERDYKIISDFDLKQETTPDWERENGTPRKHIYGTGTIAGGKNKVKIRTVNGDVVLRKKAG